MTSSVEIETVTIVDFDELFTCSFSKSFSFSIFLSETRVKFWQVSVILLYFSFNHAGIKNFETIFIFGRAASIAVFSSAWKLNLLSVKSFVVFIHIFMFFNIYFVWKDTTYPNLLWNLVKLDVTDDVGKFFSL